MIIKEITIENFRSFYGSQTIKFDKGLTLLIGDNGDGKTTLFDVFEWLFNTSNKKIDESLISAKRASELEIGEFDHVRVSLKVEHDGLKEIEKSFKFQKDYNELIQIDDYNFLGWEGKGSERTKLDGGTLLNRFFEASIRKYSLFKGENNLDIFKQKEALKYLVDTFSEIKNFDPYFTDDEDNQGFIDFALESSNKAYKNAMRADKKNSNQERVLRTDIERYKRELSNIKERLRTHTENYHNYKTRLDDLENSKDSGELLNKYNEDLKTLKRKIEHAELRINDDYSIKLLDDNWILCQFEPILDEFQNKVNSFSISKRRLEDDEKEKIGRNKALSEVSDSLKQGFVPLSIYIPDEATMKEMINDEVCKVCGREAKKGSDAYNFMINKLNDYLKSLETKKEEEYIPIFINNYIDEFENYSHSLGYNKKDLIQLISNIKEDIEFNETRKQEVKELEKEIENIEDLKRKLLAQSTSITEDELQNAYANIVNWTNNKNESEHQINFLKKEQDRLQSEINRLQAQYDCIAKDSSANVYSKIHFAFQKIQDAFRYAKEKNTDNFLKLLEEKSNSYLKKLNVDGFYGIIRIRKTFDNSAEIDLIDSNELIIKNENEALKTTKYMSVLFAISELTTIKRENDYPLIFDAPTSSFAPQKERDFFEVISKVNKQCIIVTKSFLKEDGKLDKKRIDTLNCSVFRLEKKRPFNSLDLTTIQTVITPINK